jgi:hypothetical protein
MVPPVPRILGPVRKAIQNLDSCQIAKSRFHALEVWKRDFAC